MKTKSKKQNGKPGKPGNGARVMWATKYAHPDNRGILTPIYNGRIPGLSQIPVLVLDSSPEAHEARVEAGAKALCEEAKWPAHSEDTAERYVRAVLSSLGDTKGGGRV